MESALHRPPKRDIALTKAEARRAGLEARAHVDVACRARFAERAEREGVGIAAAFDGVVSLFAAMRGEPDLTSLAAALRAAGRAMALPVVQGKGQALLFRRWAPGDALVRAAFGVSEPLASAEEVEPSLIFTPLAAFDRLGGRVGYGGGYYDRTLAALRARHATLAVGVAFSAQELAQVPMERTDQRLDMILTESETIIVSRRME